MLKAIIQLKSFLITLSTNNEVLSYIFKHKKLGTPATLLALAIACLLFYVIYKAVKKVRENKYRPDTLAELGLLNKKLVGLNNQKKQMFEHVLPSIKRHSHILEIQNVSPALKKDDIAAKREQLERIYFPIFRQEIAGMNLVEK